MSGRHRAPTRGALKMARVAVGGLVLAEVTGGFAAIPAYAAEPPALARTPAGHALERHHDHHHHHRRHAPKAVHKKPVKTAPAPQLGPVAPQELFSHYTVRPGDTLTHIAAQFSVPWESLWAVNTDQLDHPDLLTVGQQLRLPV